tara:strand:+ start:78 stop:404 length:327 start_codon:yes stop_codon:yes gene_type:complete
MTITKEKVKKAIVDQIIVGNGHAILDPEHYEGFDVQHLVFTHKSDYRSGKSTIYTDGLPVDELEGVYNLDFLHDLCDQLDIERQDFIGRGFQAQECASKLEEWANNDD